MNRSDENAPASYGLLRKLSKVAGGLNVTNVNISTKKARNLLEDSKVTSIESDLRALGAFGVPKVKKPKAMRIKRNSPVISVIDIGL